MKKIVKTFNQSGNNDLEIQSNMVLSNRGDIELHWNWIFNKSVDDGITNELIILISNTTNLNLR